MEPKKQTWRLLGARLDVRIHLMNIGTLFQEDGLYKLIVKLGDDGWPRVKRFSTPTELLVALQRSLSSVPSHEVVHFCLERLSIPQGRLVELPGQTHDWQRVLD